MKYFTYSEFDSPDIPGSGHEMEDIFLEKLDLAREQSGVPYVINSGFRTAEHNAEVGGVSGSSHLTGWAADIRADSSNRRFLILRGMWTVTRAKRETFLGCIELRTLVL